MPYLSIGILICFLVLSCKQSQDSSLKNDSEKHLDRNFHTDFCLKKLSEWKKKAQEHEAAMNSEEHVIPEDGRMTKVEREYQAVMTDINNCVFDQNDNKGGTSISTVSENPSFANACKLINGIRVCNMDWDDSDVSNEGKFVCRHFAWTFKSLASKRGLDCNYARVKWDDGGRHAQVTYKIDSRVPGKDRYCIVEPQANRIEECWYVNAGERPENYPQHVAEAIGADPESQLNDPWKASTSDYFYSSIPENEKEKVLREITGYDIRKCRMKYAAEVKECESISGFNPFQDYAMMRRNCKEQSKIRFIRCTEKL